MKRVLPVLALTVAGLIPVWRYAPSHDTGSTVVTAPAPVPSATAAGGGSTVFTGPTVDTEKGPVQVEVTFDGDTISAVRMLQQPDHPQTEAAVPTLIEETLSAQSADIDTVSGATLTSDAYRESLQAALDAQAAEADAPADEPAADEPAADEPAADEPAAEPVSETLAGPTVNTEKGPVQVEVTFDGDTISAVRMLQQPNHPQTTAAVPQLIEDTLSAQGADIDTVSGATITSDAYKQSLQAVLDAKGV
ncbi:FMN-binding protein [Streptomyces sp. NPDC004610]|uniref:FMN-binding protein n=1 Tax=unclassified Streptomyces TaxID=2593676 RepID=UPI0033B6CA7A